MGRPRTRCDPCHRAHLPCERNTIEGVCTRCVERNYQCFTSPTAQPKNPYPPRPGRRLDLAIKVCGGEGRPRSEEEEQAPRRPKKKASASSVTPTATAIKVEEVAYPFGAMMDLVPSSAENGIREERMKARLMGELLSIAAVMMAEPFMRDKFSDVEDNPFQSDPCRELLEFERAFDAVGQDPTRFGRPWAELIIKLGVCVGSMYTRHSSIVGPIHPNDAPPMYGKARQRFCVTLFRACANEFLASPIAQSVSIEALVMANMFAYHMPITMDEDYEMKMALHRLQCGIFALLPTGRGGFANAKRRKAWFECLMTADVRYSLGARHQPVLTDQQIRQEMAHDEVGSELYLTLRQDAIPIPTSVMEANKEVWGTCVTLTRMVAIVAYTVPRTSPAHAQSVLVRLLEVFEHRQAWKATMWPANLGDPNELSCHILFDTTFSLGLCFHILDLIASQAATYHMPSYDLLTRRCEAIMDQCLADVLRYSHLPKLDIFIARTFPRNPGKYFAAYLARSRTETELDYRLDVVQKTWEVLRSNGFLGGMFLQWLADLERQLSTSFGPVTFETFENTVRQRWRAAEYGRYSSYPTFTPSSASPQSQGSSILSC